MMKFLLITEIELEDLCRPHQAFFEDTRDATIYHDVLDRGMINLGTIDFVKLGDNNVDNSQD
jgi:hypothetical protein